MEHPEKIVLVLNRFEHNIVLRALNELRNGMLEHDQPSDTVDDVLLKVIDAPQRKARTRDEAR